MNLSNRNYDLMKFITTIVLPAFGTLYFTLSEIWHLPYGKEVVGTIAAVTTFFGVCLRVSNNAYNKLGYVPIEEDMGRGQEGDSPNESHH